MKLQAREQNSKQSSLGLQVSKYVDECRGGRCSHQAHQLIVAHELSLGLPEDPWEKHDWYEAQKKKFGKWDLERRSHQWRWAIGQCNHCLANETLVVRAASLNVCVTWCLNTIVPWYPTGFQNPWMEELAKHSESCTSHSSFPTSLSTESLSEMRSQWQHTMSLGRSSFISSSSAKTKVTKKSSSGGPRPKQVLSRPKLPGFSIPKKSN